MYRKRPRSIWSNWHCTGETSELTPPRRVVVVVVVVVSVVRVQSLADLAPLAPAMPGPVPAPVAPGGARARALRAVGVSPA